VHRATGNADVHGQMAITPKAKKKKRKRKRRPAPAQVCRTVRKTKLVAGRRKTVKVRKCRPKARRKPKPPLSPVPSRTLPPAAVPGGGSGTPPVAPPPAPPRLQVIQSPIGVYAGTFGPRQAERLLWRAGFGPRPGQAEALAAGDLEAAVLSLTRPTGQAELDGPAPTNDGQPLNTDAYYGAFLYWLDRMVRSRHQLVERLALVFHDWWAVNNDAVGSNRFMLDQTNLFRAHGLGRFSDMVRAVTADPAMLLFLNGISNRRNAINENYARELMELFCLGADRGAYTETDVRELARALSGWMATYSNGWVNFRWETGRWDSGQKTVFGRRGPWRWEDACRMVVEHPLHASFFVGKLWSYFIPVAPDAQTAAALEQLYVSSGHAIRPVLEAILCAPELYEGPRMVKPPIVHCAGMLRARERPIDDERWWWLTAAAGQLPYHPPDVSGWNDRRWLDTNTVRARWDVVSGVLQGQTIPSGQWNAYPAETATQAVASARRFWGDPDLTAETVAQLEAFGSEPANPSAALRAQRQNALRQLVAACPDYQTC